MRLFIFNILLISLLAINAQAQEMNCSVQISARQIEGTDRDAFKEMQQAIYEFVNSTTWSNYDFKIEERIDCTLLLTLSKRLSSDTYEGKLNLVLKRPVFNSNYSTTILNHEDNKVTFTYVEGEPLTFDPNSHTSNLSSLIAYYMYMFLGLDADTFSPLGGTPYYLKAQTVVQNAQGASEPGWKAFESSKNRYWLVENLLNPQFKSLRQSIYQYHRLGLDLLYDKADKARSNINESLKMALKTDKAQPGSFLMRLYLDAKREELINIFSEGNPSIKSEVANTMKTLDPIHSDQYSKIAK